MSIGILTSAKTKLNWFSSGSPVLDLQMNTLTNDTLQHQKHCFFFVLFFFSDFEFIWHTEKLVHKLQIQMLDNIILFYICQYLCVPALKCVPFSACFYPFFPFLLKYEMDIDSITSNQCTNAIDTFHFWFG